MGESSSARVAGAVLGLAALCAMLALSQAVVAEENAPRRARTVGLLPALHLEWGCDRLFVPAERPELGFRHLSVALQQSLAATADINLVPAQELRRRISGRSGYAERLVVGRERYQLGHDYYRDLRQEEAEESLTRAVEVLDSIFHDVVEPGSLSEILFLLGITLVEEDKPAQAHLFFKRALLLSPGSSFAPGYHPPAVERALTVACNDLHATAAGELPLGTIERTLAVMAAARVDVLFLPLVQRREGRPELLLVAYDRKSSTVAFRRQIPLLSEAEDSEQIDRAVSAWAACTPFDFVPPRVEERSRFYFSAAYQHLLFIQSSLRSPLQTMGFSFDGAAFIKPAFGLLAKVQLLSSLPDPQEDLLEGITSLRVMVGPVFAFSGEWWRVQLVPSGEVHYLGSFATTRNPHCKHYLGGSAGFDLLCADGAVRDYPTDLLAGINLYAGVQFFLPKDLFVGFGLSGSTYFYPFDRSLEMNFPIAAEVGGGVAF